MSLKQLGRYEITGTLGRGAMGVVYQAHDPLIERMVAIKTVSYAGLTTEEAEEFECRFFLEAKSAGRLNHPNIVTIYDVGRGDGLAYIAMELLKGQTLRELLDSGVVLSTRRIIEIALRVATGLAFAHANGVVHRDIKPANIMVLDNKIIKIADFGIALLPNGAVTLDGAAFGSPKYMSPEQVQGRMADGRSDIFSLGAVLYEMLTGRSPFTGNDLNAILYQVLNGAPPLPSSLNPRLPQGFDRIVARALSKNPDKRYQNAAEMAEDLRHAHRIPGLLQASEKVDAESGKASQPLPPKPTFEKRPRALRYGGVAAAVLLTISVGGYLWWSKGRVQIPQAQVGMPVPKSANAELAAAAVASPPAVENRLDKPSPEVADKVETADASPQVVEASTSIAEPLKTPEAVIKVAKKKVPATKKVQRDVDEKPEQSAGLAESEPVAVIHANHVPANDWQTSLREELAVCGQSSFLSRVICNEKARWKYCPGHWGSVAECPGTVPAAT